MHQGKTLYKKWSTIWLVCMYTAFFLVHSVFKLSLLGFQPVTATSIVQPTEQAEPGVDKQGKTTLTQAGKKTLHLNKRFQPEPVSLAPAIQTMPLHCLELISYQRRYESSTQQRILLMRSLRAPPAPGAYC